MEQRADDTEPVRWMRMHRHLEPLAFLGQLAVTSPACASWLLFQRRGSPMENFSHPPKLSLDSAQVVRRRLEVYKAAATPVEEYYEKQSKVRLLAAGRFAMLQAQGTPCWKEAVASTVTLALNPAMPTPAAAQL